MDVYMERERELYLKELSNMFMEAGESKICSVGCQAGDPGRADVVVQVHLLTDFSLARGGQSLFY